MSQYSGLRAENGRKSRVLKADSDNVVQVHGRIQAPLDCQREGGWFLRF